MIEISLYLSFTHQDSGGNGAGIVMLKQATLTDVEMCRIAAEVGLSETVFITTSQQADYQMRYFTPVDEVALCGHATIAAAAYLDAQGLFESNYISVMTQAGKITLSKSPEGVFFMSQATPIFESISSAVILKLTDGISGFEAHPTLPACIGSTGLRDILLPVKSRAVLNTLAVSPHELTELSRELGVVGAHLFALEGDAIYARNFAPLYGIDEECATGTSNGVLIAYLHQQLHVHDSSLSRRIIQGEAMNRTSAIYGISTKQSDDTLSVLIGGRANAYGTYTYHGDKGAS